MKKSVVNVLAALGLAASTLYAAPSLAEDFVEGIEEEVVVMDEEMAPGDAAPQTDAGSGAGSGEGDLIEEAYEGYVEEGSSLEEYRAAEEEEEARIRAQEEEERRLRELMESADIYLEKADPDSIHEYLSSLLRVDDPTGSDGELEIGAYIKQTMAGFGYTVSEQGFHEGFLNANFEDAPGINIIAERGADSIQRTSDIILICCHYDSVTAPEPDELLPNDKSGAAAVMECARILSTADTDVDICFLFLSGEEDGSYGALRFAERLEGELKQRVRAVIYVGPVGYVYREIAADNAADDGESEDARPAGRVSYLIGSDTAEGNEVASYFRSVALYGRDEAAIVADSPEETTQAVSEESAQSTSGESGQAAPEEAAVAPDQAAPAVCRPEDWTIVADTIGSRQHFADQGMQAIRLFQDVFREAREAEGGEIILERRLRSQVVGEYVTQDVDGEEPDGGASVAGEASDETGAAVETSGDAAASSDAENASGAVTAAVPELYPVRLDVDEVCTFTDLLAGMVSLYMTSDISLQ